MVQRKNGTKTPITINSIVVIFFISITLFTGCKVDGLLNRKRFIERYKKQYDNFYGRKSGCFYLNIKVPEYELTIYSVDTVNFIGRYIFNSNVWDQKDDQYRRISIEKKIPKKVLVDIFRIYKNNKAYHALLKDSMRFQRKIATCVNSMILVKIKEPNQTLVDYWGDFIDVPSDIYNFLNEVKLELQEHGLYQK